MNRPAFALAIVLAVCFGWHAAHWSWWGFASGGLLIADCIWLMVCDVLAGREGTRF